MINYIEEFSNILSGCKTLADALYFTDLYSKSHTEETKKILMSIVYGTNYNNTIDLCTMKDILNNMSSITIEENENSQLYQTDNLQRKVFIRISNIMNKKYNKIYTKKIRPLKKNCPHCNKKYISYYNSDYVICGLEDEKNGFNWDSCGKDWCFKCEKKLCKSWSNDKLFLHINRIHDNQCCKEYAKNNNQNYLTEYCHCKNQYVNRSR